MYPIGTIMPELPQTDTLPDSSLICEKCGGDGAKDKLIGKKRYRVCRWCYSKSQEIYNVRRGRLAPVIYARISTEHALESRGVPSALSSCRFENYAPKTDSQRKALKACKSAEGSVFITGSTGAGKSHLAVSIMRRRVRHGIRSLFISAPDLLMKLRASFNEESVDNEIEIIEKYSSIPFLIIDDIGAEKSTAYALQAWYVIINRRWGSMLPTIYTSNLSLDQIAQQLGERISSRLASAKIIGVTGPDHRISR